MWKKIGKETLDSEVVVLFFEAGEIHVWNLSVCIETQLSCNINQILRLETLDNENLFLSC